MAPSRRAPFSIEILRKDTVAAARSLLGAVLWHRGEDGVAAGRIVETEAYLRDDPACHASRGLTPRNEVMFGPAGRAYIYFIYGMYHCFNVVTGPPGVGEAVLIRALEPLEGGEFMARRRGKENPRHWCNGPAKLVLALGIDREHNSQNLSRGALRLLASDSYPGWDANSRVKAGPRVGISAARDWPLRFYLEGNPFVSKA